VSSQVELIIVRGRRWVAKCREDIGLRLRRRTWYHLSTRKGSVNQKGQGGAPSERRVGSEDLSFTPSTHFPDGPLP